MVNVIKLAVNDLRNILRDRFLVYASIIFPVMMIVVARIIRHFIAPEVENVFPLVANYPVIFMLCCIFIPIMFGFITAFLIIDERDEHLLTVLRVMPISRNTYLIYRMLFMSIFAFIVLIIFPPLSGLLIDTQFSYGPYIPVAVLFCLFTPFIALLVTSFAQNKVQAFAIFKISGTVFILPLLAFVLHLDDIKYIFSPLPNFWTYIALDSVIKEGTLDVVPLIVGFIYHIALLALLFYIFNKKN